MHRILLPFFLLSLTLPYAGSAVAGDEEANGNSLIGTVAEVVDATDGSDFTAEGDDGALFTSYLRYQLPSLQMALRRPSPPDILVINQPNSALIRAPPACFS